MRNARSDGCLGMALHLRHPSMMLHALKTEIGRTRGRVGSSWVFSTCFCNLKNEIAHVIELAERIKHGNKDSYESKGRRAPSSCRGSPQGIEPTPEASKCSRLAKLHIAPRIPFTPLPTRMRKDL